ncbi:MAG: gamma-glutamyltransferase [Myxococcota bacterium]
MSSRRRITLALLAGLFFPALLIAAARAPLTARRGMVASSHALASAAGVEIMRKGGNAVDAAVAVTLAVGVVDPQSAGIGGGGFALWYRAADHTVRALDFRERAPLGATAHMYQDSRGNVVPDVSTDGYLAVAVPGTVAGLEELHRAGGKLPWREVVAPAIKLAEEGFLVGRRLNQALQDRLEVLKRYPESASIFLKRGVPYDVGDLLIQRDLADTLRTVQEEGAAGFYSGDIARAIASDMEEQGGLITLEDLAAYKPVWRRPLSGVYRGHTVVSFPPPSSGGVHLLQMLQLLSAVDVRTLGRGSTAHLHVVAEAMRRAYADRATWLGDPAFVDVPVDGLLSPGYLAVRWSSFSPQLARPLPELQAGDPWPFTSGGRRPAGPVPAASFTNSPNTAHLSIVDGERNAVALTFTINTGMGSGAVVRGTGILLNNEMDDFSAAPGQPNAYGLVGGEANAIAPTKIPLSSMTPTLLFTGTPTTVDGVEQPALAVPEPGQLRLVVGAPGGSTIITTVLQVIMNMVDFGDDVAAAVAHPRVHHQWLPDALRYEEDSLPPDVRRGLFARGHTLKGGGLWGNATAVAVEGAELQGASDPRGDGVPAGY